jgi:hypothetical protein
MGVDMRYSSCYTVATKTIVGGMAEWTMAVVLKTIVALLRHRGFESLSLRLSQHISWGGARVDDWGRLLSGYPVLSRIAGSNPVLPARQDPIRTLGFAKTGRGNFAGLGFSFAFSATDSASVPYLI